MMVTDVISCFISSGLYARAGQGWTYTGDDECYILVGVEIADGSVQCRREGILKQPSKIWVAQSFFHIRDHFLQNVNLGSGWMVLRSRQKIGSPLDASCGVVPVSEDGR